MPVGQTSSKPTLPPLGLWCRRFACGTACPRKWRSFDDDDDLSIVRRKTGQAFWLNEYKKVHPDRPGVSQHALSAWFNTGLRCAMLACACERDCALGYGSLANHTSGSIFSLFLIKGDTLTLLKKLPFDKLSAACNVLRLADQGKLAPWSSVSSLTVV